MRKILITKDLDQLSATAADLFARIANESMADHGSFSVALSGGSTPRTLYTLLASEFGSAVDWQNVSIFIGDERNVPADSAESNFRMLRETLVEPLGFDHSRFYRWRTELSEVEKTAAEYESELKNHFDGAPRFDLMLLGLGSDAHTASLFPGSAALREIEKLAVANWVEKIEAYRLTMTFPVINNAANAIFIVSGREKARAVAESIEGEFRPDDYPAQLVQPVDGELYWLLDASAASVLESSAGLHLRPVEP